MATKAENLTFLSSKNGTSNTPALYIAVTTTHAAIEFPRALVGKFVKFINESSTATDYVDFFFSGLAAAEVDRTVASSASGAQSPKLGDRLFGSQTQQGRSPYFPEDQKLYLIVEGSTSLNLRVVLVEQ